MEDIDKLNQLLHFMKGFEHFPETFKRLIKGKEIGDGGLSDNSLLVHRNGIIKISPDEKKFGLAEKYRFGRILG